MKELLILRHAKSVKGDPRYKDYDRPLDERGEAQIPVIGQVIQKEKIIPDYILSSSAKRTRETTEKTANAISYKGSFHYSEKLYEAETSDYIEALSKIPNEYNRVMLVGHNPTHENYTSHLAAQGISLSTGALAYFKIPIKSWKELDTTIKGELVNVWRPKDLMQD